MIMKCKPTWQFQSVEFDYNVNGPADLPDMFNIYKKVLQGLMEIAPVQDPKQQAKSAEPLATQRQKEIMDQHGIKYTASTTQKQAYELINKSMNG